MLSQPRKKRGQEKYGWRRFNKLKMIIQRFVLNNFSDLIITNSQKGGASYIKYGYKDYLVKHVPNAVKFDIEKKIRNEKPPIKVLSVGRFITEKDYPTALKTIEYLLKSNLALTFKYTIVGYGPLKNEIVEAVSEMNLNGLVEIVENPSNIHDYYDEADVFFLTSIDEGMPNVVLEAMMNSLPVVSTKAGDIERMVDNEKSGFIHEQKDYKGLANSLKKLILSIDKRNEYGHKGYELVSSKFSVQRLFENYKEIISILK